jgi:hypothetical protein
MTTCREVLEGFLDELLSSWTALDLAVTHFDGQYREAQARRECLIESLTDAIIAETFEVTDIAEFLTEFLFEQFSVELDDESHYQVATVISQGWKLIKQGVRPQFPKRASGATNSTIADNTEEVSGDEDAETHGESMQSNSGPRIVTDEDGWSTVVPRNSGN